MVSAANIFRPHERPIIAQKTAERNGGSAWSTLKGEWHGLMMHNRLSYVKDFVLDICD